MYTTKNIIYTYITIIYIYDIYLILVRIIWMKVENIKTVKINWNMLFTKKQVVPCPRLPIN